MSPPPEPQQAAESGGNMFTRKYGPIPGWGWILLAIAGVYLYSKYQQSKQSATTTTTTTGTAQPNALTSNLVGVAEPVPTLAGTYQVSVQPASGITDTTGNTSTQGVATPSPPSGQLTGQNTTTSNANSTAQVTQPQTATGP